MLNSNERYKKQDIQLARAKIATLEQQLLTPGKGMDAYAIFAAKRGLKQTKQKLVLLLKGTNDEY